MKLELDTKEFQKSMQEYAFATKKDEAEVLNKAGFNILLNPSYGVIKNTPKAKPADIQRELTDGDRIALKIAASRLKGKGGKGWQRKVGREARSIISKRKRSSGYIVAGWLQINHLFGGRRRVAAKDRRTRLGDGRAAAPRRLVAVLENMAEGADKVGRRALVGAVRGAGRDMRGHAQRTMEKTARRYSGR